MYVYVCSALLCVYINTYVGIYVCLYIIYVHIYIYIFINIDIYIVRHNKYTGFYLHYVFSTVSLYVDSTLVSLTSDSTTVVVKCSGLMTGVDSGEFLHCL